MRSEEVKRRLTLYVVLLQVYPLQQGDQVGATLPRSIFGSSQNVSPRQRDGDALLLKRDHSVTSCCFFCPQTIHQPTQSPTLG